MAFHRTASHRSLLRPHGRAVGGTALAMLVGALSPASLAAAADKRCDWHGPKAGGEIQWTQCVDYAALNGQTLNLPHNVTRIAHDGLTFCSDAFKTNPGAADIVYMMDNSGSMESGENAGGFNSPPGDPFGIRDRVIRKGMRQQQISADTATAGFISFFGLGPNQNYLEEPELETRKLQPPLNISRSHPQGAANLQTLLSKVWKKSPNEAALPKTAAGGASAEDRITAQAPLAKKALTYWSEALRKALDYLNPAAGHVRTRNHAIVLISDGAIGDWREVEDILPQLPPVYGIHLGLNGNAKHLEDLCRLTKGKFYLVSPTDTATFHDVMASIIGVITRNPLPKEVKVMNSSLSPAQTSRSVDFLPNPDGSLGLALDSIIALRKGPNSIAVNVSKDDGSSASWSFGLNVAEGGAAGSTGGNLTCYEPPRLRATDGKGDTLDVYSREATRLDFELRRSPSELTTAHVGITATGGDRETAVLKPGMLGNGFTEQDGSIGFNAKDGRPSAGNGKLQVNDFGDITFTWTHPRDPRETASYILLGRKVPVVTADVAVQIRKEVVHGPLVGLTPAKLANPVVIVDKNNTCVKNCVGTEGVIQQKDFIPGWTAIIKSPIRLSMRIFDNLGQFVNESAHEVTQAEWEAMPKDGDSAKVEVLFHPVSHDGRIIATGAYLMRMEIQGLGGGLMKNSAGETVEQRASKQEYFRGFGYVRQ